MRQLLQNNYLSPNGNGFSIAAALKIGLGVPVTLFSLAISSMHLKNQVSSPFGSVADKERISLFAFGSFVETLSELQRKAFKDNKANKGKIYTGGLFKLARHVNYLGEVFWYTGYALLTTGLPFVGALFFGMLSYTFIDVAIPELGAYMELKYKKQWEEYKKATPYELFPLIK